MAEVPVGTVTLLFSDVEGSTLLLSRLGPQYAAALDGLRQVQRAAWAAHGGTELGTEGDSFYVVFSTAEGAVTAAVQAQRALVEFAWPGGESVRVRMGIHSGSPTPHESAYVGMDVHRAARIAGAAHGGQILVSRTTADLVEACLPQGARLLDLGAHQLKDIPAPERLLQVSVTGLPEQFPPPKTMGTATSLPKPATQLVGRDEELAELTSLLGSPGVRLVTLTGPGGTGKTRLAIELAQQSVTSFPDGVYFVPLAAVTTPDVMWTSIAEVLDVPPEGRIPPGFFAHVAHRSALFVLDNLEQIPGADTVVAELLAQAPQVMAIATTRRPLHVAAEHEHPVPPLRLPDNPNLEGAEASSAVQLFVQHARKVRPSFTLTTDNADAVVRVCRRLDGLPLAIELAAARTKLLTPVALLTRLHTALELKDTGLERPNRQRTLRETIAWSHDLLNPDQQVFFRRLGVFSGGADLDAVAAVAAADLGGAEVLGLVADLVDASLIRITEGNDAEPRVDILGTIRAYALDLLTENGELDAIQDRHAQHYLGVAEVMGPMLADDRFLVARSRFEAEDANFREALEWALPANKVPSADRADVGLRLCAAVGDYWGAYAYFSSDASIWLDRALERADSGDSAERAKCLRHRAAFLLHAGDPDAAHQLMEKGLAITRQRWGSTDLSMAIGLMALIELERGAIGEARSLQNEALAIARRSGERRQLHVALSDSAIFNESHDGDHAAALALKKEALAIARDLGAPYDVLIDQQNIACSLRMLRRVDEAHELMRTVVPDALRLNVPANLMYIAEDYAAILAEVGQSRSAATLLGAADALHERSGVLRPAMQQQEIDGSIAKARTDLSPQEWDEAYQAGRNAPIEDVLDRVHSAGGAGRGSRG